MGEIDAAVETLHKLGLTILEAKVYTVLATYGYADAKTVARCLNIARCEVYRAFTSLEKIGLIEKLLTIPSVYIAIPIKDATRFLLENKAVEYLKLQKETSELVTAIDRSNFVASEGTSEQVIVMSEGKIVGKRLANQLRTTQKSFETMSTWNVCARMLCDWAEELKLLTKKKITVRVLTDNLRKDTGIPKFLVELQKSPSFQIRYYKEPLTLKMSIRDQKEVNVCLSEKKPSPNAWSNNLLFTQLVTKCFECMWNEAAVDEITGKQSVPRTNYKAKKIVEAHSY